MLQVKHSVSSSDGTRLNFTSKTVYQAYQAEAKALDDKYYALIRAQDGVWATNQNKFVASPEQLTTWDIDTMEKRFAANLKE